jgi:hypothetical protein
MRILFFILLQFFAAFVWSAEENFEDRIVNYLVSYIEQNEAHNDSLIQRGESEKVNRTIYIDFNEILEDEPRVLKAYATNIDDLSEEYPKTKKSSDIFNTIQDQIKFYNVLIGAMPDYFKIIQQPSTYRYGNKIANTGGYYDSYSGYYSIGNYYGANQETLYKLMRNTLSRVSEVVEVGENVVFNYFAFTKKQTPKKPIYINFVHTDFVGDLFVPHLQDLKTDLTGMMAAANSSVYSNSQYSLDEKLNYHLGASVKVLLNKRSEENSILESAILTSDPHDSFLPWECPYQNDGPHIHGVHILGEYLEDNGFDDIMYPSTSGNHIAIVAARQEQETGDWVEYEIELRLGMGNDSIWDILSDWGITNKYDYCCHRFGDSQNRNLTDWITWYDNYALDTPPMVVDLIARIIAAPFLSAYGYWYGTDALTGAELTGLDYIFNALDLIPGVAALSKVKLGIKSFKLLDNSKAFIASSQQFISKIPTKLYTFVKEMSSKALALLPKANGALVVVAKETSGAVREILEFGADQVIKVLREIDPGMAPPQVVYDLGSVSVRQGDQIVERQLQIVKTGDGQVFVKSTLTALEFSNQIDNTILRLSSNSTFLLNGTGKYKDVFGHHPLAKKAFEGDIAYDYKEAFCISTSALDEAAGIANIHPSITGQQNSLYSNWRSANPGKKLSIDEMADIEIQAMVNVGISSDIATGWVIKALEDLKLQGVSDIRNIPWNGTN